MWIVAVLGLGIVAFSLLTSRSKATRAQLEQQRRLANELAALRCDLDNAVREAQHWFAMDLAKPAWDAIADAFAILEVLKGRLERDEWTQLQTALLAAIPRAIDNAIDARPAVKPRVRRLRRKSRNVFA
jgi:hypothetical protein